MFDRILRIIRDKMRQGEYVLTTHAEEEMDADQLNIFDVEECILAGWIVERQKDRNSGEWKYVIQGRSGLGGPITVVVKLGPTNKVIVLTVFAG